MTYTKEDIAKIVTRRTGVPFRVVKKFVDIILQTIADMIVDMKDEDRIELRNFGVFKVWYYFPESKRNPQNNNQITLTARRKVRWKPSKVIKKKLLEL